MATFSVASSINDVSITNNVGASSWSSCISASTGTSIASASDPTFQVMIQGVSGGGNASTRAFLYFDTGSYIPAGATVTAASLSIRGNGSSSTADLSPVHFCLGTFPVGALTTSHFGSVNKALEFAPSFSTTIGSLTRIVTIENLSLISTTSYTKMVIIGNKDFTGSTPSGASLFQDICSANNASSAFWPTLTVTYELPSNSIVNFI